MTREGILRSRIIKGETTPMPKSKIERCEPHHSHRCERGAEKAADFVFTDHNGKPHYICEADSLAFFKSQKELQAELLFALVMPK
jgi:hypothetical protein